MALSTDANLYSYHTKIPTIGYGPQYKTAHSDHEKISIDSLYKASKIYALTAIEYCGIYKNNTNMVEQSPYKKYPNLLLITSQQS